MTETETTFEVFKEFSAWRKNDFSGFMRERIDGFFIEMINRGDGRYQCQLESCWMQGVPYIHPGKQCRNFAELLDYAWTSFNETKKAFPMPDHAPAEVIMDC